MPLRVIYLLTNFLKDTKLLRFKKYYVAQEKWLKNFIDQIFVFLNGSFEILFYNLKQILNSIKIIIMTKKKTKIKLKRTFIKNFLFLEN